jgi:hypothetical protein
MLPSGVIREHWRSREPPILRLMSAKRACPCCGYQTLSDDQPGSYEICEVCFWEDDIVQFDDPDYEGGANKVSLRQARINFREFGSPSRDSGRTSVRRAQTNSLSRLWRHSRTLAHPMPLDPEPMLCVRRRR